MAGLTHLDPEGRPQMVDVSAKAITRRLAVAAGYLELDEPAAKALTQGGGPKGDPWSVARIGAVGGVKRTSDLIPLAHPLAIEAVDVSHHWDPLTRRAWLKVQVSCEGRTGIEMEALAGVTVGLLVLYDMLKAVSHGMVLGPARLLRKEGGRRGTLAMPWADCPWEP
ncbi:cyclic pyranopterin monophosphate synthase MoaC [Geothrix sp. PMB-07]|uniref:cyclic pyranopterin monophosphate synthase MoaC n=1 Tax=Geothrix sp. PMB-07 TaxID=3068640 RepID=UPI0027427600|nr:cyclic pyranopterin monophosphate synthase MoaC [Geothrix sp. PMB-07]WLT31458.1 cyclic pyranopterin monophosphate synthase MoaC [Geothrix sp. PMB-07]